GSYWLVTGFDSAWNESIAKLDASYAKKEFTTRRFDDLTVRISRFEPATFLGDGIVTVVANARVVTAVAGGPARATPATRTRRIGDDHDPPHGVRGAALVRSLGLGRFGLSETQLALAETASRDHTGGGLSADPTIGTCWDADRLTLRRVGIEPAARYMSTPSGRAAAASGRRFPRVTEWSALARRVGGP